MPRPSYLCTDLDSLHPGPVRQPHSSVEAALARAGLTAPAMTQTYQQPRISGISTDNMTTKLETPLYTQ